VLKKFPKLRETIDFEVKGHIRNTTKTTMDKVEEMIKIECSYINNKHKDFKATLDSIQGMKLVETNAAVNGVVNGINATPNGEINGDHNLSHMVDHVKSSEFTNTLHKMAIEYVKIIETTLM
jgi:hypothetical protein